MKKILSLVICLLFITSCVTSYTYTIGDITTFNANGDTLKVYNNILLTSSEYDLVTGKQVAKENPFKLFGVNFYDPTSKEYIIISNSTPYTINYKAFTKVIDEGGGLKSVTKISPDIVDCYDSYKEDNYDYDKID